MNGTLSVLDRWLSNGEGDKWNPKIDVTPFTWSDHDMVNLHIAPNKPNLIPGALWKLNAEILKDKEVVELVRKAWKFRDGMEQKATDPQGWWDDTRLHISPRSGGETEGPRREQHFSA